MRSILERGDKVIATSRNTKSGRLDHLKTAGAAIVDLDVTASQESLNATIKEALAVYGRIDVLINNAAYIEAGPLEEMRYAGSL